MYPYFWARPGNDLTGWTDRVLATDHDDVMREFLAAGYARILVPVRPGFAEAVCHFVETKTPYSGLGDPTVDDPLYRSIVAELKEQDGADQYEVPVGEPWSAPMREFWRGTGALSGTQRSAAGTWGPATLTVGGPFPARTTTIWLSRSAGLPSRWITPLGT